MSRPLVSIIIPFYNAQQYLPLTLQSAIAQTWAHKEIILIDDGSTDHTLAQIEKFQSASVKIYQQQNKGAAAARNLGLSHAKGQYIQFLDADDLLSPDKIEKQVLALIDHPDEVAVCSTIHFNDGQDYTTLAPSHFEERFIYSTKDPVQFMVKLWGGLDEHASMIQPNAWLTPINLIRKVGPWNENLTVDDDGEYFARIILNSKGIIKVDQIFNYYRKQANQKTLSGKKSLNHLQSQLMATCSKKKELLSRTNSKEAQQAIHRQLSELIVKSYPKYPAIYKAAIKELPAIDPSYYQPSLGGPKIQKIVDLLGWKTARIIQYILKQK